jgi:hypothetical protein
MSEEGAGEGTGSEGKIPPFRDKSQQRLPETHHFPCSPRQGTEQRQSTFRRGLPKITTQARDFLLSKNPSLSLGRAARSGERKSCDLCAGEAQQECTEHVVRYLARPKHQHSIQGAAPVRSRGRVAETASPAPRAPLSVRSDRRRRGGAGACPLLLLLLLPFRLLSLPCGCDLEAQTSSCGREKCSRLLLRCFCLLLPLAASGCCASPPGLVVGVLTPGVVLRSSFSAFPFLSVFHLISSHARILSILCLASLSFYQ